MSSELLWRICRSMVKR